MLGNFSYCNPTKLYFGDDTLKYLNEELPKYGKNVVTKRISAAIFVTDDTARKTKGVFESPKAVNIPVEIL